MDQKMKEAARRLARQHKENEPEIIEIWLFPDDEMIRLVEVAENEMPPGEDNFIRPYYFGPNEEVQYNTGIALIREEDVKKVNTPEGWCDWSKAIRILPEGDA